jgi:NAD(P)-dependent dehydrogenase (short-subunit alcohol dehydrogenase family)
MTDTLPTMFDLSGRVAILTGGGGMLGRQFLGTLLQAGAKVVVADVNADAARDAAKTHEGRGETMAIGVDISRKDETERLADETMRRWGRIDILVNNAAIDPKFDAGAAKQQSHRFEDYPIEAWRQSLDVNLTGPFLCCQAVGKVMVRQRRGVIVNISSMYGLVGPDQRLYARDGEETQAMFKPANYAVTKAGVAQLTRYLAAYWGDAGIRVNTLTPGGVQNAQDEEFLRRYADRTPMGRMALKTEMSGALLFLVSDASSYVTGSNVVVDGGWTAW